ncbi:hypothetical protein BX666DRAFT_1936067 [Dichotomocladium elegans]|nr:hypothetical protein BX666DRAFT_1936067 [Dichotomocladium elegans]
MRWTLPLERVCGVLLCCQTSLVNALRTITWELQSCMLCLSCKRWTNTFSLPVKGGHFFPWCTVFTQSLNSDVPIHG